MPEMRKLAAVMFTDIVGYTKLMSHDEHEAIELLQKNRNIQQSVAGKYGCEFFKDIGDGTLLCFQSALDAVHCALEIQQTVENVPNLNLRIGIHLGDTIFSENDVLGDGVNVASRIEPLAQPGGICISKPVYEQIRNQSEIDAVLFGEKVLKNVDHPIKIYTLKKEKLSVKVRRPAISRNIALLLSICFLIAVVVILFVNKSHILKDTELTTQQWEKSLAVLPFADLSQQSDQEYFVDGMTEQLITNLSKFKRLKVISRTSVMRFKNTVQSIPEIAEMLNVKYILEGSVRKAGNNIRVTAQLIDTESDFHVWADDFDSQLENIFILQDTVSELIAHSLLKEIPEKEIDIVKTQRTNSVAAYEYFLRGKYYHEQKFLFDSSDKETFKISEMMFKRAIALDSLYAPPFTALADLYHSYFQLSAESEHEKVEYFRLMNEYVGKAFNLDSTLAYNYLVKGRIKSIENKFDEAFKYFKIAFQKSPNVGWMNYSLGLFFFNRGLNRNAIKYIDKAITLDPLNAAFYLNRGISHHYLGNFEAAEKDYEKAIALEPNSVEALEQRVNFLIDLGMLDEAERQLSEISKGHRMSKLVCAKLHAAKGEERAAINQMGENVNFQVISLLGLRDRAISFMQNTIERDNNMQRSYYDLYSTNPCYSKVREIPQFQEFLEKHKVIYDENFKKYRIINY